MNTYNKVASQFIESTSVPQTKPFLSEGFFAKKNQFLWHLVNHHIIYQFLRSNKTQMTRRYYENSMSDIQQLLDPWAYIIFLKHETTLEELLTKMQTLTS